MKSTTGMMIEDNAQASAIYVENVAQGDGEVYSYILNAPRPGTSGSGAVHFINAAGRSTDGGASTYTIRNDSGKLRLGGTAGDTILEGNVGIGGAASTTNTLKVTGTVEATTGFSGSATSAATLTTARYIGGVSFNGSASIDLPGVNTGGNQNTTGTSGGITFTEVDITAPNVTSGASTDSGSVWTQDTNSAAWGTPKFNTTYNGYAYADFNTPAGTAVYRQWNIPTGMKSAYMSQLQWSSGGYVDVHGVQSDGGLVFLRRVNTHQSVENANEGNPGQHDGSTITFIGSGLESYVAIRITNKLGRLHPKSHPQ